MVTDEQLIEQIRKGESEAYGQLFRRYYQRIHSICFSIIKNPHDAEEVTQETFVTAYLKLNQLKKPDKFFAWLKKIAQNYSKKYARRTDPEIVSLDLASVETARDGIVPVQSGVASLTQIAPDEHILRQELRDSIMAAVEALPPKDRAVVRAHIDGLNHAEISERFGISVQASMSRLSRARKKLTTNLKDLLNAIFGLPKMLSLKTIISGGILAMKIGMRAKVTIGVIGVLIVGIIGFRIVTHQPDVKSPKQQQVAKLEVRQRPVSKMNSRPNESGKSTQDEQDVEGQADEFLAWLDALEQSTPVESQEISEQEEMEQQELPDELEEKSESPEEISEPTLEAAPPPETFVNQFVNALRNLELDTMLSMARGQAREKITDDPPQLEAMEMLQQTQAINGYLVTENEYRFNLLVMEDVTCEIVIRQEGGRWWVDEIINN